jgi:hypothetical protein
MSDSQRDRNLRGTSGERPVAVGFLVHDPIKSTRQKKRLDTARRRSQLLPFFRENRAVKGFTRRALRALDSAIFS